jgi:hypothetical protein
MKPIAELVSENSEIFFGAVCESIEALHELESTLAVTLPQDVCWFLVNCGSGDSGAVPNIKTSISDTLRYRAAANLPNEYLVLDERNDGGTVFLNTKSQGGAVAWVDAHAISAFSQGTIMASEMDNFASFAEWVAYCIDQVKD